MKNIDHDAPTTLDRRQFVIAAASAAALVPSGNVLAQQFIGSASRTLLSPGDTILFQGDSITDAGRKRGVAEANSFAALGTGYAWLAASQLLTGMPDSGLKIFNRGISGNKVFQLAERWQSDCLDLKPNMLSILIGVNDFWHKKNGNYDGTLEKYETDYQALLKRTKESLPNVKLVLCEPFVLTAGAVDNSWLPEFAGYRAAAKRVAEEAGAVFVPFQTMFDEAVKLAPPEHWAGDGVHPSTHGAALMAAAWRKAVGW